MNYSSLVPGDLVEILQGANLFNHSNRWSSHTLPEMKIAVVIDVGPSFIKVLISDYSKEYWFVEPIATRIIEQQQLRKENVIET